MNPIQQLIQSSNAALAAHHKFLSLYDGLCDAKRDLPNFFPLPWDAGELQLTEEGKAIVRWKAANQTVILVAVVANDPSRRVWGWGYHDKEPYYDERMQERPPQAWLDFVGAHFTE